MSNKWNDKDFVLEAVHQNGESLQHASEELKNDKDIVLEAVKQDGYSLRYASEELRNNKKIAFEALKQDYSSSCYIGTVLRGNKTEMTQIHRRSLVCGTKRTLNLRSNITKIGYIEAAKALKENVPIVKVDLLESSRIESFKTEDARLVLEVLEHNTTVHTLGLDSFYDIEGLISSVEKVLEKNNTICVINTFSELSRKIVTRLKENKELKERLLKCIRQDNLQSFQKDCGKVNLEMMESYEEIPLLHYASLNGSMNILKYLIEEKRLDISQKDFQNKWRPIVFASAKGMKEVVHYLLKKDGFETEEISFQKSATKKHDIKRDNNEVSNNEMNESRSEYIKREHISENSAPNETAATHIPKEVILEITSYLTNKAEDRDIQCNMKRVSKLWNKSLEEFNSRQ